MQQHCSGRCGTYNIINVTIPDSVIIPCGSLQPSNTTMVDYCNATSRINEPLEVGATMQYNLMPTRRSHHNNIIYCTNNQIIFCYKLNVFCKKTLYSLYVYNYVVSVCETLKPLYVISYIPSYLTYCLWSFLYVHIVSGERFAVLNFHVFHSFQEYYKSFPVNISTSLQLY